MSELSCSLPSRTLEMHAKSLGHSIKYILNITEFFIFVMCDFKKMSIKDSSKGDKETLSSSKIFAC